MSDPTVSYCPHCKDITKTEQIAYRMNINLLQAYPQYCGTCSKDKNTKPSQVTKP